MRVVTAAEMRALDERTIHGIGVPGVALMESAGRAVVNKVAKLLAPSLRTRRIVVVAGPGNNGGDGFVIARHLHERGARVTVLRCAPEDKITGDARTHHDAALRSGVLLLDATAPAFAESARALDGAELIVDALLGTGLTRDVSDHFAEVIARINASPGRRVAVDIPSGMDADSGLPRGACVAAQHTVTFALPKLGLVSAPGFVLTGELTIADIGISARLADELTPACWLLDATSLAPLRAPRPGNSHKGTFGHLCIVAGWRGHTGAALLAGEAAMRAGVGLCTVASTDEGQRALASRVVEVMTAGLGQEPLEGASACAELVKFIDNKDAVAFGPGVGTSAGARALLEQLLTAWAGPLVVDADGLNLLAASPSLLAGARAPSSITLTPHPAEMARLAGVTTGDVQADRLGTARRFAALHNVHVVLKGARTVIAAPDGRAAIVPVGNPGMATGGSGDVLTGIVGALAARGLDAWTAATAGAYWHGAAGDHVARARGENGMIARDLIDALAGTLATE